MTPSRRMRDKTLTGQLKGLLEGRRGLGVNPFPEKSLCRVAVVFFGIGQGRGLRVPDDFVLMFGRGVDCVQPERRLL